MKMTDKNANKIGYKKTKLGWIPENWKIVRLENCFTLTSGITKPQAVSLFKDITYKYPIYGGNGIIGYADVLFLKNDTILIGRVGEKCGCVYLISNSDGYWVTDNALFINSLKINFNFNFMYYQLLKQNLNKLRSKSGQPLISQKPIYETMITFPPIIEQEKIAEVLSCWDDGIEVLEKLLEKKQLHKKALMQRLLSRKLILCCSKTWKHSKFNSIFERIVRKNKELNKNILTISAQQGLISQKNFYNKRIASIDTSKYILLELGEFAYNKSYSNGYPLGAIKRLELYQKGVVSSLYICFKLKDKNGCSDYWKYYFEAGMLNKEIKMIAQEGARNHGLLNMTTEDFFNILLYYPEDKNEQQKIAQVLNNCDEEIRLLGKKLEMLKQQKKGLMQKLLTGEIRIKA